MNFFKIVFVGLMILSGSGLGCSPSNTSVGVGVGIVIPLSPEASRNLSLSTWYSGSSLTSSTTMDKEEFVGALMRDFLQKRYAQIAEESAQGQGSHLEAIATLIAHPAPACPPFAEQLHHDYSDFFPAPRLPPNELLTKLQSVLKQGSCSSHFGLLLPAFIERK